MVKTSSKFDPDKAPARTKMGQALSLAEHGFKIIQLKPGQKEPADGVSWLETATLDPDTIREMFAFEPDMNYGAVAGDGFFILDIDTKKADGLTAAAEILGVEINELPAQTFAVRTPSGGMHLYFKSDKTYGNSASTIAKGLDSRSGNGYVVGPGSTLRLWNQEQNKTVECSYDAVSDDLTIKPIPERLRVRLTERGTRAVDAQESDFVSGIDLEENIAKGRAMLRKRKPAVEFQGGNHHTYATAALVRDHNISFEKGLELMSEWNEFNEPPWSHEKLEEITRNAYNYANRKMGTKAGGMMSLDKDASIFGVSELPEELLHSPLNDNVPGIAFKHPDEDREATLWNAFKPYVAQSPAGIRPRQLIYGVTYFRGEMVLTIATGGTGKTSLVFLESYDMVTGALALETLHKGPVRVAYCSFEDSRDELVRKIEAIRLHYSGDIDVWNDRLHIVSFKTLGFKLTERDDNGNAVISERAFSLLEKIIREHRIDVVHLDPWVNCHEYAEADNTSIGNLAMRLSELAESCRCCIHVIHHTRKVARGSNDDMSQDDARGASSLVGKSRMSRGVVVMSKDEAQRNGVSSDERWRYIRVDDLKLNYGPPRKGGVWYRKIGVSLGNGENLMHLKPGELPYEPDNIGVLERVDLTPNSSALTATQVQEIRDYVLIGSYRADVQSSCGGRIHDVIGQVTGLDPYVPSNMATIKEIKRRLEAHEVLATEMRKDGKSKERKFSIAGPVTHLPEHSAPYASGDEDFGT